jgi:hypothetical protein
MAVNVPVNVSSSWLGPKIPENLFELAVNMSGGGFGTAGFPENGQFR